MNAAFTWIPALTLKGLKTISVRNICKALLLLARRPDGNGQPPPTPPKIGGEPTANTK